MSYSNFYNTLISREKLLRETFLNMNNSETGDYDISDIERMKGYIMLVHASIEEYLECLSLELVKSAQMKWDNEKKAGETLVALLTYSKQNRIRYDGKGSKQTVEDFVLGACREYIAYVKNQNHGLKEKNIRRMFLPLGVKPEDIDSTLCVELNNFGSTRGVVAHTSGPTHIPSPVDIKRDVDSLIEKLKLLDQIVIQKMIPN